MKSIFRAFFCLTLLSLFVCPLTFGQLTRDKPAGTDSRLAVRAIAGEPPGRGVGQFVGRPVRTQQGNELGALKDVLVDVYSGRVVYAAIESPAGKTLRLVPFAALQTGQPPANATLKIEPSQWEQIAPVRGDDFSRGRLTLTGDERRQLAERFGQSEVAPAERGSSGNMTPSSTPAATGGSQFVRLDSLRGKTISTGTERVGRIADVVVDDEHLTAAAIVEPEKDFAVADRHYLIPLQRLNLGARDDNPINTTLTRSDFEQAHQREAGLTASPASSSDESPLTPTGRSSAEMRDRQDFAQQLTRAVQEALSTETTLTGGSISIAQENDRLVLRGSVESPQIKERIEQAIRKVAPGASIDNQITVEKK